MPRPRTVTDDAVLDAVLRVVGRVGPARLTLAAVGAEAGLSPAALVQRFGSRRGLLVGAARRGARGWPEAFAAARASHPPLDALVQGLVARTAPVATPEALANHLAFLALDLADAELHALALQDARALRSGIAASLRDAVVAGELPDVDVDPLAQAVETAYHGALVTWAVYRQGSLEAWLGARVREVLASVGPVREDARRERAAGG